MSDPVVVQFEVSMSQLVKVVSNPANLVSDGISVLQQLLCVSTDQMSVVAVIYVAALRLLHHSRSYITLLSEQTCLQRVKPHAPRINGESSERSSNKHILLCVNLWTISETV